METKTATSWPEGFFSDDVFANKSAVKENVQETVEVADTGVITGVITNTRRGIQAKAASRQGVPQGTPPLNTRVSLQTPAHLVKDRSQARALKKEVIPAELS